MQIVVVHLDANPLLSLQTSNNLGIISFPGEYVGALGVKGWLKYQIIEEYRVVFDGLGCLEGTYSLVIDNRVQPVIYPARKVPVSLRDKLKEHLDQLVKNGILAPVTVPTDFVLSMVVFHREASSLSRLKTPQQCNFPNHVTSLRNHEKIFCSL